MELVRRCENWLSGRVHLEKGSGVIKQEDLSSLLVGTGIERVGRTVDMGDFQFLGPTGSRVALHIQCPFRMVRGDIIILGSQDMLRQKGDKFDPFLAADSLYDSRSRRLNEKFAERCPVVVGVDLQPGGFLTVHLEGGAAIEAVPDSSRDEEAWRVFARGSDLHHVYPAAPS
ncbi:hypothetical protein [Myceligenerans crystallogenes]|uniref:Uncharacterized protein n=1 Tax=Myceligenerans crystallogenes TaxID=316335 RepID=A0ABP4ZAR9_9MICO